jgi:hypothetical protein
MDTCREYYAFQVIAVRKRAFAYLRHAVGNFDAFKISAAEERALVNLFHGAGECNGRN